jgi:rifampicin phosphotransferase
MARLDATAFSAPGPGTWVLDAVHFHGPVSRYHGDLFPERMRDGFRDGTRRYGLLFDTLEFRIVNGFAYFCPMPVPEAETAARIATAEAAYGARLWRDDMDRWEREVRPASIRAGLALQAVDPAALTDDELVAYVDRCIAHHGRMIRQHHSFNVAALLPIGDLMASVAAWTGLPLEPIVALVRGAAPESAGTFPGLDALAVALREHASVEALLDPKPSPAEIISGLRVEPGAVGNATRAYLDLVGNRLLDSVDAASPTVLEQPSVLVEGIRRAVAARAAASKVASQREIAAIRDLVPAGARDEFDEVLAEARRTARLRDERGLYSDVWAAGISRRALLAAGARQVERGRLLAAADLVEAGPEEIRSLLAGAGAPSAEELAARADYRSAYRLSDAPPFLGPPPQPPAPLDELPGNAGRMMRAVGMIIGGIFAPPEQHDATIVRGRGVSVGDYTGTARVVRGPADFDRIEIGDVLVAETTTDALGVALPLLGAIVTDSGGVLSHAGIVAREFGIPAVVGCGDATARIAEGAKVRVDGATGEVQLL